MTVDDVQALIQKMYEHDRDQFDLERMILAAEQSCTRHDIAIVMTELLRSAGPAIFEAGYFAGAGAGMEVAAEVIRSLRREIHRK